MFTDTQKKLLDLNLNTFPLMAAASVAIKQSCSTCPSASKTPKGRDFLKTAAMRYKYDKDFKDFLKAHFKLPIYIAGILFQE